MDEDKKSGIRELWEDLYLTDAEKSRRNYDRGWERIFGKIMTEDGKGSLAKMGDVKVVPRILSHAEWEFVNPEPEFINLLITFIEGFNLAFFNERGFMLEQLVDDDGSCIVKVKRNG